MTSIQRVRATLRGGRPDRPATFDCLANDAIIRHFAGQNPNLDRPQPVVHRAIARAIDSTRIIVVYPQAEGRQTQDDGTVITRKRWTSWYHRDFNCVGDAADYVRGAMARIDREGPPDLCPTIRQFEQTGADLGDTYLFANFLMKTGIMLYGEIGLEHFSYLMADEPQLLCDYLDATTNQSVAAIEATHFPASVEYVFDCEDIAYRNALILSPSYLRRQFIPRLEKIIDAWHRKSVNFIYHSDGNILELLADLVAVGIDGLNPIETQAAMPVAEVRRLAPDIVLIGGVDCSQILPHGTPQDVRVETQKVLAAAGPQCIIGSSSEVHNAVPLENYLAFLEAVDQWRW